MVSSVGGKAAGVPSYAVLKAVASGATGRPDLFPCPKRTEKHPRFEPQVVAVQEVEFFRLVRFARPVSRPSGRPVCRNSLPPTGLLFSRPLRLFFAVSRCAARAPNCYPGFGANRQQIAHLRGAVASSQTGWRGCEGRLSYCAAPPLTEEVPCGEAWWVGLSKSEPLARRRSPPADRADREPQYSTLVRLRQYQNCATCGILSLVSALSRLGERGPSGPCLRRVTAAPRAAMRRPRPMHAAMRSCYRYAMAHIGVCPTGPAPVARWFDN